MVAVSFDDEPYVDPDDLKVPERPVHRHSVDLIAVVAEQLLGHDVRLFKDMNWYPDDQGNAVAPDAMVISAEAIEEWPRSYRQDQTGGPPPLVVVEVPSDTDTFSSLRAKARRYQRLGTTTYAVAVDEADRDVIRLGRDDHQFVSWVGEPIPELGGLRLHFEDGGLVATLPDGARVRSVSEFVVDAQSDAKEARRDAEDARQVAEDARRETEDARREAEEARCRAEDLAAQLRALGVEAG